jgi:hypothetical protein
MADVERQSRLVGLVGRDHDRANGRGEGRISEDHAVPGVVHDEDDVVGGEPD